MVFHFHEEKEQGALMPARCVLISPLFPLDAAMLCSKAVADLHLQLQMPVE